MEHNWFVCLDSELSIVTGYQDGQKRKQREREREKREKREHI